MNTDSSCVLRPSAISGVGVFTTTAIAAGERLHQLFNADDCVFVEGTVDNLPEALQHYVVLTRGGYWRPESFRAMSIGWYLNHSDTPNLRPGEDNDGNEEWVAARAIAANEELTIDYRLLDPVEDNSL